MLRFIDDQLNKITMYRLVVYCLGLLGLVAFVFSITGVLDFEPVAMLASLAVIMTVGFAVNQLLAKAWALPANIESGLITCLIVFLLVSPTTDPKQLLIAGLVTLIALASKFVIAFHGRHIFNPAAFGFFVVGLLGLGYADWWVGSSALWIFALIVGLLVARKIRRLTLVAVFWAVSLAVAAAVALSHGVPVSEHITLLVVSSPLIFLGSIMLTEPSTMPPMQKQRILFAIIAAILFAWNPGTGFYHIYPETALLIANIYAFAVGPKRRWRLTLSRRVPVGNGMYDFEFRPDKPLRFTPGQYMEVTMPVKKADDRGNRRTFTIASSPDEENIHVGIRLPDQPSRFKQVLTALDEGAVLHAGQIAGSFVLPDNTSRKLLFIAGGVGITPFRSMAAHLVHVKERRDIILIYVARDETDFMYKDVFGRAESQGMKVHYVPGLEPLTESQLSAYVKDIDQRHVYISGPPAMTRHFKRLCKKLGVRGSTIKTDYFTGY